jgi:hypothetical protein
VTLTIPARRGPLTWNLVWQRMPVPAGKAVGLDARDYEVVIGRGEWKD